MKRRSLGQNKSVHVEFGYFRQYGMYFTWCGMVRCGTHPHIHPSLGREEFLTALRQLHLSVFSSNKGQFRFGENLNNRGIRNPQDAGRKVRTKKVVIRN